MRVRVRDVCLYFDIAGMGLVPAGAVMHERPVVVCLHGGPGFDHSMLKPYLTTLSDVAQLVFVDHRGNGRSDTSTPEHWNLDTWIDDMPAFCSALGIERPILLGQSFGAIAALGVASRYPELPAKLIVSSGAARIRFDRALEMTERVGGPQAHAVASRNFEHTTAETQEEYLRVCIPLYNTSPADPAILARVVRRHEVSLHFWQDEIKRFDLFPEVGAIRCPTLILGGELDPITTAEDVKELAAAIPGSRLQLFPDAGHGVFRDKPAETLSVIRDFILSEWENDRAGGPRPPAGSRLLARSGIIGRGTDRGDPMESWDIGSLEIEPHRPQILRSDDEIRVIAIRLPGGEELQEHQVHERAYLLVADGEIEISQDGSSLTGGIGFLSHFEPNERRTIRALTDARLVLVLAPWPGMGHPSRTPEAGTET